MVKLLQRKEEKKEAFFEKVKAVENGGPIPKLQTEDGLGPAVDEPKRVFLRRPKDGFASANVVESPPPTTTSPEDQPISRSRPHHKSNQRDQKQPAQTYEERQAAYQAARNRILGTEYKPDNQEIKEIKFIDRSKSPETLKMTQQNMVEHYGEELSRELMQQPVENFMAPQVQFVPDFSHPPPYLSLQDRCAAYNGPHGYQTMSQNVPQSQQQHQFIENPYYMQVNGQMPVQYVQNQMPHFIPQDPSAVSPSPQGYMDSNPYYYCQPNQQQMNYVAGNLPNMAYPPPNFPPQGHQNQQIMNQMNSQQMLQMRPMNGPMLNQFQVLPGLSRPNNPSVHGASPSLGPGRVQNKQQMMFQSDSGPPMKPPSLMSNMQEKNTHKNGGQPRQFHNQQNGQFNQNQNSNFNGMTNGRKQSNKNSRAQQKGNDILMNKNNFNYPHPSVSNVQNPIPFG
ncbi:hypothetical protein CAEBREN_28567 [Caenorhabditis brenneri]|uniref:SUZ domain-containing protein n=1 Tax=Caenorhabditis brenneri TaxID=135651 RepID=G0NP21_CAEBE|nr:hypothetical protein CAEBREN_28567 [Caenorhabditis brenneri]